MKTNITMLAMLLPMVTIAWTDVDDFEVEGTTIRESICYAKAMNFFGMHMFVVSSSSTVFDACFGPALGTQTILDYLEEVVDYSTFPEFLHSYYCPYVGNRSMTTVDIFIAK